MATKYLDHGAYGAYAATPTWGVPQEGDGTAKTASAASAVVSIDLTTAVFTSGSSTVSIMGATALTVGAGANSATNIQYNATLTTMINNIVTVVNTLATALIVNKPAGWQAPQIRNAVFARRTGNTLEIMTRTGSADWNGLTAIAFSNVTNASSGTWASGSGGCFGYLINPAAIWASGIAVSSYGLLCAAPSYAGKLDAGDIVKIRANKTITLTPNTTYNLTISAMGSIAAPVVYQIDDGTEWPADGSTPVLTVSQANTGQVRNDWTFPATTFLHLVGKTYSSGQRNLVFYMPSTGNTDVTPVHRIIVQGSACLFSNIDFLGKPDMNGGGGGSATLKTVFSNCRFQWATQHAIAMAAIANGGVVDFYGCEFNQIAPSAAQTVGVVTLGTASGQALFAGCKFTGFVTGSILYKATTVIEASDLVFQNCDFGNVSQRVGQYSVIAGSANRSFGYAAGNAANGDYFYETQQGFVEWNSSKGYPTLNATMTSSGDPWVIYASPSNQSVNLSVAYPFRLPQITKINSLSTGTRTLTVNLLVESTLAWTKKDISVAVTYTDSSGLKTADSFDSLGGALTTTTEAWTSTAFNGQTWVKRSFSISLPDLVTLTDVSAIVRLHTSVANNTLGVFIDPELVLA